MITILIKSFNRPFYLDRCLASIHRFVKGNYKVNILDDGTPEKYLNKIKEKYPEVNIQRSGQYHQKVKIIQENLETGKEIDGFQIPTQLWIDAVKNATDFVLVTEDDVWFTKPVDLEEITTQMKTHETALVKLGWHGNTDAFKKLDTSMISEHLNRSYPKKLFTSNRWVMDLFMHNKFKFFSLLYRLGLVDHFTQQKYWQLNSILMGVWQKDYWLYVWKDVQGRVDEKMQLRNAAVWFHENKKNLNMVATSREECMKTTFQSSATNSYHKSDCDFDVNYFNHLINEAWLNESFDVMQNFPQDFSLSYFEKFLDKKINREEFRKWVAQFKDLYRSLGATVD
ncbi:glycosyltransferase family 2 protein [Chryseobacterium sp. MDT2-18]|uniref:glycosyltransferase family 2 protein n=1 Tax=Chryseobacterium sp. MDT2-18 TaxID=1259136 RepID=UPI0027898728|nr:glycosyltransferase family 2 protein [Chryseobacterium sp. MDT2-18]MDQ0476580.1 glycosyltransferase involved in cell wall biosynthesis [Chryseobacterium sp. MDT2-18]